MDKPEDIKIRQAAYTKWKEEQEKKTFCNYFKFIY